MRTLQKQSSKKEFQLINQKSPKQSQLKMVRSADLESSRSQPYIKPVHRRSARIQLDPDNKDLQHNTDLIDYLKLQNLNLKAENQRKDQIIDTLLDDRIMIPPTSPKIKLVTKLPSITPPTQKRQATIPSENCCLTSQYTHRKEPVQNNQNFSFGIKDEPEQLQQTLQATQIKLNPVKSSCRVKNTLIQPLFKLPEGFHIQNWKLKSQK